MHYMWYVAKLREKIYDSINLCIESVFGSYACVSVSTKHMLLITVTKAIKLHTVYVV